MLAAWWAGNLFAADLSMLGAEDAPNLDDRFKTTSVRTLILRRFLSLGMFVVILAGIPPQNVLQTSLPVAASVVPAVIAYFVLGIILLSLTRYITLETTWWQDRLQVPAQIPRRWFAYSAIDPRSPGPADQLAAHQLRDGLVRNIERADLPAVSIFLGAVRIIPAGPDTHFQVVDKTTCRTLRSRSRRVLLLPDSASRAAPVNVLGIDQKRVALGQPVHSGYHGIASIHRLQP